LTTVNSDMASALRSTPIALHELRTRCAACGLRELCLPIALDPRAMAELETLVAGRRRLRRGEPLFQIGAGFESLFAIRYGSLKSAVVSEDGREQITGYHLPGDLLGLDGIGRGSHSCQAVALEDAEVCVMPYATIEDLSVRVPQLHSHLNRVLSREIARDYRVMLYLGAMRAEERLAAFLLNLSERYHARGYSASEFVLRMTREEIGNYLGLKLETVSRLFSRFQEAGLVRVKQRSIALLDREGLRRLISAPR
jgi:CRP/FNR family transcriptional regulator